MTGRRLRSAFGFLVQLVDGPAQGFEYLVFPPPDERIGIAPMAPVHVQKGFPAWMRVLIDEDPVMWWPGTLVYERTDPIGFDAVSEDGDLVVAYRLAEHQPAAHASSREPADA